METEFHRGDLFWGENSLAHDFEQSGRRPYLIVSNKMNNRHSKTLTVVPLTTQEKRPLPTHCNIYINEVKCTVLCEQITTIAKSDFVKFIRRVSLQEFGQVEECIKIQLGLREKQNQPQRELVEQKAPVKKENFFKRLLRKLGLIKK